MKTLHVELAVFAMATCSLALGCAPRPSLRVAGPAGTSEAARLAMYEVVVRDALAGEAGGDTVLVSFGSSWVDHVDPPPVFFARLGDAGVSLEPVSRRDHGHRNAVLLEVRTIAQPSETDASVSVVRYRFGVGACGGFTAEVKWADGAWRVVRTTGHWET